MKVVEQRAQVSDADVARLRQAGFDDGQIVEIMAHIALDVPIDFPKVALK